ncbi:MAG: Hpt domain-containing protein, partial [Deltaproteobacteria bacterium]|nr:Hpt domain-containing protein [Deltaproteobacteria bacterium]
MVDLQKYKEIFVAESGKYFKELDNFLIRVEQNPDDTALWREIHGKIHSIKGMAKALSMNHITQLSHAMEEWCKLFQKDAGNV